MHLELSTGRVDLANATFHRADGQTGRLTPRESATLARLARVPNAEVSRDELLRDVWADEADPLGRVVDTTVSRLRRKLELGPGHEPVLITSRCRGYRLILARLPGPVGPAAPSRLDAANEADPPEPALLAAERAVRWERLDPAAGADSPEPASAGAERAADRERILRLADREIDLDRGLVRGAHGETVLTTQQLDLLRELDRAGGRPVEIARLARVLGLAIHMRRSVATAVYRLRLAVEPNPDEPVVITSVRGRGYRLAVGADAPCAALEVLDRTLRELARQLGSHPELPDCVITVRSGRAVVELAGRGEAVRGSPPVRRVA